MKAIYLLGFIFSILSVFLNAVVFGGYLYTEGLFKPQAFANILVSGALTIWYISKIKIKKSK